MTTKIRIEVLGPDPISLTVHNKHTSKTETVRIGLYLSKNHSMHPKEDWTLELDNDHSLSICGVE